MDKRVRIYNGDQIVGRLVYNGEGHTKNEICELCGVEVAHTQDDYENLDTNGKYDFEELTISYEKYFVLYGDSVDYQESDGFDLFYEAMEEADSKWNHLTKEEKKHLDHFYIVKGFFDGDGCFDYNEYDIKIDYMNR